MKNEPPPDNRRLCKPGDDSDDIKIDEEFQGLLAPLSDCELVVLHQSIGADQGCRDALIVWKDHDNTLVDGHNRLSYSRKKGYPFWVVEKEFADREAVKAYVVRQHLGRREPLPPGRKLPARHPLQLREAVPRGRSEERGIKWQGPRLKTDEALGAEYQVDPATIRRDGKLAEAVDGIVANCGPDAKNQILARDAGLTRGGIVRLSRQKPEQQEQFLKDLKEGGKPPRQLRKRTPRTRIMVPTRPKELVEVLAKNLGPKQLAEAYRLLGEMVNRQEGKEAPSQTGDGPGKGKGKSK